MDIGTYKRAANASKLSSHTKILLGQRAQTTGSEVPRANCRQKLSCSHRAFPLAPLYPAAMPPVRHQKRSKPPKGKTAKIPASDGPSSDSSKPISLRDIQWKPVAIPSMALSAGPSNASGSRDTEGETQDLDWDPFAELDEGADDFMGLQEVSGVAVKYEGNDKVGKRIAFYQSQPGVSEAKATAAPKTDKKKPKKAKADENLQVKVAAEDSNTPHHEDGMQETPQPEDADEEEEEFKGFEDDEESSQSSDPDEAQDDTEIPQGVFSLLQSQIDDDMDDDVSPDALTFSDASFDGEFPRGLLLL